jgi:hypothetical protein
MSGKLGKENDPVTTFNVLLLKDGITRRRL